VQSKQQITMLHLCVTRLSFMTTLVCKSRQQITMLHLCVTRLSFMITLVCNQNNKLQCYTYV